MMDADEEERVPRLDLPWSTFSHKKAWQLLAAEKPLKLTQSPWQRIRQRRWGLMLQFCKHLKGDWQRATLGGEGQLVATNQRDWKYNRKELNLEVRTFLQWRHEWAWDATLHRHTAPLSPRKHPARCCPTADIVFFTVLLTDKGGVTAIL